MKQLTIRGLDEEVAREIERLARREGISLNRAVNRILRRGTGLGPEGRTEDVIGHSLDHLIGTWSDEEAEQLERVVADFEVIDESMWE